MNNQPVPQWAMPFLGDESVLKRLDLKFNPVWLRWFLDTVDNLSTGGLVQHNMTSGLQGGTPPDQYYHLSQAQHSLLTGDVAVGLFFLGPSSGAAAPATFRAPVTSDLPDGIVTYAKIQQVSATDKILGRSSAGAGVVEEITCTAAGRALIDDASATAQRATLGLASTVSGTYSFDGAAVGTVDTITITNGLITGVTVR